MGKRKKIMEINDIFGQLKSKINKKPKSDQSNKDVDKSISNKDKKHIDKQDLKKKLLDKLKQKKLQKKSINSKMENKTTITSKRKTSDGFKIYTEEELGLNIKCKNTALCPFDCDCCF